MAFISVKLSFDCVVCDPTVNQECISPIYSHKTHVDARARLNFYLAAARKKKIFLTWHQKNYKQQLQPTWCLKFYTNRYLIFLHFNTIYLVADATSTYRANAVAATVGGTVAVIVLIIFGVVISVFVLR